MKASFREPGKAPFMEPQVFRRHAINLLVGIGAYCCVSAGLNYWMDPWQIYGPSRYSESRAERITLAHNIRNAPPFDVLLLGSSRVRYLIDNGRQRSPDRLLTEPYFGNQTVFNAALAGSNIYQMRRIFEHALYKHKPKELVLLLDDVMLNSYRPLGSGWHEYNYYGSPSYQNSLERALSLVDFAMLKDTAALILEWIRSNEQPSSKIEVSLPDLWGQNIMEFSRRDLYGCYEINAVTNRELDQILTLAKSHGVRVTLIVSFIHPALFEYSYRSDDGRSQRLFLSEVRNLARKYQVPAWFFSPYSSLSSGTPHVLYTSPDFEANPDFYDPGHANSKIGHKMLATAFKGESNADLVGYRLNESTIDDIFASLKRQREKRLRESDIRFAEFVAEHPLVKRQACPTEQVR